ncbi:MAG: DUF4918 family protein [Bacteroidales bacterium]|nr:DUF4918 family protein [Bacteroidales bacterium]
MTFAEKVITFYSGLNYAGPLPSGVSIMNPFANNPDVLKLAGEFYTRFCSDHDTRFIILGINPGRFGAGATGIPFTDTKRLNEKCGIRFDKFRTHEPSSSFIYEMIDAYGGVYDFYKKFYFSAVCPLGFTRENEKGKAVNYNYYDSPLLTRMVCRFIIENLKKQLDFGIDTSIGFCLGTGKNENFLRRINAECKFFKKIIALEHPRYIMQYKTRSKQMYIEKYLDALRRCDS